MQGTAIWIASGIVGVIGMLGVFVAANAADSGIHLFGLGLAAFAIIYVSAQLKQSFDEYDHATLQSGSKTGIAALDSKGDLTS